MSGADGQQPDGDALGRIADPADYKQRRRIQEVLDARADVREIHLRAEDRMMEGLIRPDEAARALYTTVRHYAFESEQVIKRNPVTEQWFWRGWYPTESGEPPIETEYLPQHNITVPVADEDGEPEQVALEPNERLVDPETGEELPREEWDRPRLATDRDGEPLAPTLTNVIGREPPQRPGEAVPIMGLKGYVDLKVPMTFRESRPVRHQLKIWEEEESVERYQVSVETSLRAARLLNRFWDRFGLGLDQDGGLPKQTGIDFADGELGYVENGGY